MQMSDEVNEIFSAFSLFQSEVEDVKRDTQAFKYKYATLDQVMQVRTLLSKYGLGITQLIGNCSQGFVELENIIIHKSGQYFTEVMKFPIGELPKGSSVAQHIGSNISYARRYGVLSILGMAQEDDDAQLPYEKNVNGAQNIPVGYGSGGGFSNTLKEIDVKTLAIKKIFDLISIHNIPVDKVNIWKDKFGVKDLSDLNETQARAIVNKLKSIYDKQEIFKC